MLVLDSLVLHRRGRGIAFGHASLLGLHLALHFGEQESGTLGGRRSAASRLADVTPEMIPKVVRSSKLLGLGLTELADPFCRVVHVNSVINDLALVSTHGHFMEHQDHLLVDVPLQVLMSGIGFPAAQITPILSRRYPIYVLGHSVVSLCRAPLFAGSWPLF